MYVHVDMSGTVWYGRPGDGGDGLAVSAGCSPAEFAAQHFPARATPFRLFGLPVNAELICRLHDAGYRVQLGSPRVCLRVVDRQLPDRALYQLRYVSGPASVGGWHTVTQDDIQTYRLAASLPTASMESIEAQLREHPAYRALSYPAGWVLHCAAAVVSEMCDPRWYIDPQSPDSMSGLNAYMGLNTGNLGRTVANVSVRPSDRARYALNAKNVWYACGLHESGSDDASNPRAFLRRACRKHTDPAVGAVKACRMYVRFVRDVWLDKLSKSGDGLFDPRTVFTQPSEWDDFKSFQGEP